jgi:hypothetical protein
LSITYTPEPIADAFIQDDRFHTYICGPVGSAKTTAIMFKIIHRAQLQEKSPIDGKRRTRWVIVRNTGQQLQDTTLKSWFTWFPDGAAGQWVSSTKTFWLRFGDVEAEIMFRPLDTPDDVRRVLSLEVTGAILDEFVEIPKPIVDALSGRCGRYPSAKDGGPTWWGMWGATNPGNEDNWWYDWLYSKWQDDPTGQEKYETLGYYQQPSGFSPLAENIANLPGQRGYYTNLAKGKKEEWIKQFIEVQWGYSLKGKPVYRSFNPVIHVSSRPLIYNPHLPLVMGFDAGLTPAGVFGQMSPHGQLMVLAELTSSSMGAKRFCNELAKPILAMRFPNPALLIAADPATNQRSQTDEVTVKRILEEEMGVKVHAQGTNALAARLDAVDHFLTRLTDNGPALIIDPDCVTLIRGFKSGYRYPVSNKGQIGDSPEKNDYSHVHDAMQYLCQEFMGGEIRDARRRKAAQIGFGQRVQNPYNVR